MNVVETPSFRNEEIEKFISDNWVNKEEFELSYCSHVCWEVDMLLWDSNLIELSEIIWKVINNTWINFTKILEISDYVFPDELLCKINEAWFLSENYKKLLTRFITSDEELDLEIETWVSFILWINWREERLCFEWNNKVNNFINDLLIFMKKLWYYDFKKWNLEKIIDINLLS